MIARQALPFDRATAWVLVGLAWSEPGNNWSDEKLDGKPFDLPEPRENEYWTRADYDLPHEGVLSVTYIATPRIPRLSDTVSHLFVERVIKLISDVQRTKNRLAILKAFCREFFVSAEMAGRLLKLFTDSVSKIDAALFLLPRIVDWSNATQFVYDWLTEHELRVLASTGKAGQLFSFGFAYNPTGAFKLNLANLIDREIAFYLVHISSEEEITRKKLKGSGMLDTSQKGDWDSFRNEHLTSSYAEGERYRDVDGNPKFSSGQPFNFEDSVAEPLPPHGSLRFDFLSTNVSHRQAHVPCMSKAIFTQLEQDLLDVWRVISTQEQHKWCDHADSQQLKEHTILIMKHRRAHGTDRWVVTQANSSQSEVAHACCILLAIASVAIADIYFACENVTGQFRGRGVDWPPSDTYI